MVSSIAVALYALLAAGISKVLFVSYSVLVVCMKMARDGPLTSIFLKFLRTNLRVKTLIQRARGPLARFPGPWYSLYTSKVLLFYWVQGERASYVERLHQVYGQ